MTLPFASTVAYCVEERLHVAVTADVAPSLHVAVQEYVAVAPLGMMLLPSMAMEDKYRFSNVMSLVTVFVTPLCVKFAVSDTVWSVSVVFLFDTLPFPSTTAY